MALEKCRCNAKSCLMDIGQLLQTIFITISMRRIFLVCLWVTTALATCAGTNPQRASSSTQLYITQENVPRLDGKYTIFGRVLRGMEVVDTIASVATDSNDRPLKDIRILSTSYAWSCPLTDYRMVWHDEFDGDTLSSDWQHVVWPMGWRERCGQRCPASHHGD